MDAILRVQRRLQIEEMRSVCVFTKEEVLPLCPYYTDKHQYPIAQAGTGRSFV
jgi:hypothetical protein